MPRAKAKPKGRKRKVIELRLNQGTKDQWDFTPVGSGSYIVESANDTLASIMAGTSFMIRIQRIFIREAGWVDRAYRFHSSFRAELPSKPECPCAECSRQYIKTTVFLRWATCKIIGFLADNITRTPTWLARNISAMFEVGNAFDKEPEIMRVVVLPLLKVIGSEQWTRDTFPAVRAAMRDVPAPQASDTDKTVTCSCGYCGTPITDLATPIPSYRYFSDDGQARFRPLCQACVVARTDTCGHCNTVVMSNDTQQVCSSSSNFPFEDDNATINTERWCRQCASEASLGQCRSCTRHFTDNLLHRHPSSRRPICAECASAPSSVVASWDYNLEDRNRDGEHPYYIGVELECVTTNESRRGVRQVMSIARWWGEDAVIKYDGSLGANGFEIAACCGSLAWNRNKWSQFLSETKMLGGVRSQVDERCGIHISISRSLFTEHSLARFAMFVNEPHNKRHVVNIAGRENNSYARIMRLGLGTFRNQTNHGSAVCTTNPNRVELRVFSGALHIPRFMTYLDFADSLAHFASDESIPICPAKWFATYKEWVFENEKKWPFICLRIRTGDTVFMSKKMQELTKSVLGVESGNGE